MYDAYFNLVLWLIAIALAVLFNRKVNQAIEEEKKRLEALQKLTSQSTENKLEEVKDARVVYAWLVLLTVAYILWNAREALRVFFL